MKDTDPLAVVLDETQLLKLIVGDWGKWTPVLIGVIGELGEKVDRYAGTRTLARAGISAAFDFRNPRVEAWLRDRGLEAATSVIETIKG